MNNKMNQFKKGKAPMGNNCKESSTAPCWQEERAGDYLKQLRVRVGGDGFSMSANDFIKHAESQLGLSASAALQLWDRLSVGHRGSAGEIGIKDIERYFSLIDKKLNAIASLANKSNH